MAEEWKEIKYSDGYMVSNMGRFKNRKGKLVNPKNDGQGYLRINVGYGIRKRVHQFVAEAFIPNPYNKDQINHKNNDKTDNRASNLEWVTSRENSLMAGRDGLVKGGYPIREILGIKTDMSSIQRFDSQVDAERETGISAKDINKCLKGQRKTSHGYFWKYLDEVDLNVLPQNKQLRLKIM